MVFKRWHMLSALSAVTTPEAARVTAELLVFKLRRRARPSAKLRTFTDTGSVNSSLGKISRVT